MVKYVWFIDFSKYLASFSFVYLIFEVFNIIFVNKLIVETFLVYLSFQLNFLLYIIWETSEI